MIRNVSGTALVSVDATKRINIETLCLDSGKTVEKKTCECIRNIVLLSWHRCLGKMLIPGGLEVGKERVNDGSLAGRWRT